MQKEKSLQVYRGIWLFVTRYCCKAIVPYLTEKIKFIKAKFIIDKPRNKFAFYFAYFNRPFVKQAYKNTRPNCRYSIGCYIYSLI